MKRIVALALALAGSVAAEAAVPVNDAPVLEKRSEDSAFKVEIKQLQEKVNTAEKGVKCAVTTPKKAEGVKSPTQSPTAGTGQAALEKADPTITGSAAFAPLTTQPTPSTAAGGNAAERADLAGTGQIVGGMQAVEQSVQPNRQTFETMGRAIGSDKTIQEAFDTNSGVRMQAGLSFNQVVQAVSVLAQAFNQPHIATVGVMSRASAGISGPQPVMTCPPGMSGDGTKQSPCVSRRCQTGGYGEGAAEGCVRRRYVDTAGNVVFIVRKLQEEARSRPTALSLDELQAGLRQYQD